MTTKFFFPLLLTLLSLVCFSTPMLGGKEDSLYTIELSGHVLIPETDAAKFYKLELLSDNTILETGIIVDGEPFLLRVKKNSLYTVRITKEGFSPMVISINTSIPGYTTNNNRYRFDTDYFLTVYGFYFFMGLQDNP